MKRPLALAAVVTLTGTIAIGAPPAGATLRSTPATRGRGVGVRRSIDGIRPDPAPRRRRFVASRVECTVTADPAVANTSLDCDSKLPNNEPNIAVDPTDPLHMVASSNDYDGAGDQFYTTFDGGQTWKTGDMSLEGAHRTGSDPVTAFDPKSGNVIHSSLNYRFTPDGQSTDGDVVASASTDGGITWGNPVVVADGQGADKDPQQIFNDKEWLVVDSNPSSPYYGRAYMTWTRFFARNGKTLESPIWESHSDDGGLTWTTPHEISGSSSSFCTYQEAGPASQCDEDQASVPTVGSNGTVYVAFLNEQDQAAWETGDKFEDAYLVVQSTDGGATWSDPVKAVNLEDGKRDYPLNADKRQTLTGLQVRVWGAGNIVADNVTGQLVIAYSDNSAGEHDVANPVTDSNVYVVTSSDGGATWSPPTAVDSSTTDQWFPWADVNPVTGAIGVIYNSRNAPDPKLYNAVFATGSSTSFTATQVSAAASNPDNSAFFDAKAPGCFQCSLFHGDYLGMAYDSTGIANLVWTDMSKDLKRAGGVTFKRPRKAEFIYFARA